MEKITAFKNKDGKIFENVHECAKSENLVKCKVCLGFGYETYEHIEIIPYPANLPDSGWVDDKKIITKKNRDCSRCSGLGYVVSNIEDDLDYQHYLVLKEKFKDLDVNLFLKNTKQ